MASGYYIAGPMSGIPAFNFPAFDSAAATLRRSGWEIIVPTELDSPEVRAIALESPDGNTAEFLAKTGVTWGELLSRDLKVILDEAEGIVFLPDWEKSKGARLEAYAALSGGSRRFFAYGGKSWTKPLSPDEVLTIVTRNTKVSSWRPPVGLIGLSGKAGAGKDTVFTVVRELAARAGCSAVRDAFADRLKESAAAALGIVSGGWEFCNDLKDRGEVVWDLPDLAETRLTGRQFLQYYGTEAHRDVFGDDFWIRAVLPNPSAAFFGRKDRFDLLVVTDVRFDNEAQAIKECGGEMWRVDRWGAGAAASGHASEGGIAEELIDRVIDNNGSMLDLRHHTARALAQGGVLDAMTP